jgi:hypothetical protein
VKRCLFLLLALAACKGKGRSTDTYSSSIPDEKTKVKFLDDYAMGPTTPEKTEFHVVYHDNSGGLIPGSDDYVISAAVKVPKDDVSKWAGGCSAGLVQDLDWVADLKLSTDWKPAEKPDTYHCMGGEERLIFVKDGVIYRHLVSR